ncbi:MAG: hypothetical protein WBB45_05125 [Cyclobacteriaceae bacterium]
MKRNSILLGVLSMFIACEKTGICKDDELQFQRAAYTGNQLNTDGFYYGDVDSSSSLPFANIYYFYRDGTFFTSASEDLEKAESGNIDVDVSNEFGKTIKSAWGVFRINSNEIEIARWESSLHGCENSILERGIIINDSTFILEPNSSVRSQESIFRFHPLVQKPDSTNSFIQ